MGREPEHFLLAVAKATTATLIRPDRETPLGAGAGRRDFLFKRKPVSAPL